MANVVQAPMCPASGRNVGAFGGRDQCVECGKMVFTSEAGRTAKHRLPATDPRTRAHRERVAGEANR